ncbi:MAG TPA: PIN domain-containing protein [Kiloniellales bacterium]
MIFLDTGFLIALFNKRDNHHKRVLEVFGELRGKSLADELLTTDLVIIETITFLVRKVSHERSVYVGERLYSQNIARIYETRLEDHKPAFEYLKRHEDKKYSVVDCMSFVVMERLGLREALAVDSDFTHSFVARPGPI